MFLFVATSHMFFLNSIILSIRILSIIWSIKKKILYLKLELITSTFQPVESIRLEHFIRNLLEAAVFFSKNISTVRRGTARIRIPSFCHYCERSRFDKLSFLRPVMFQCQTIAIMENPFAIKGSFSSLRYCFFIVRQSFFFFRRRRKNARFIQSVSFFGVLMHTFNFHLCI